MRLHFFKRERYNNAIMNTILKLSHHQHSGRMRPHEHTSYLPLAFLVFGVGVMLSALSITTYVQASPGPEAGSIGLSGTMPAAPPKTGAVINSPTNGQHFTISPITVSGTCPAETLVEIFKNDIFAGSTPCEKNGTFSVQIDLLYGQNILTAQVYDVLNQAGPVSKTVTVFYDTPLPQGAPSTYLNFSGSQLLLETDAIYRGIFPNQNLNVPISIIGGTPPFAVNAQWGDNSNEIIPRGDNSTFNATHAYKRPGIYKITLQGVDSKKLVAFLSVAAIVNGQPASFVSSSTPPKSFNKLLLLLPLLAIAASLVFSFWMGERREKKLLGVGKPQTPAIGASPQAPAQ
jgi:hypothetical protein